MMASMRPVGKNERGIALLGALMILLLLSLMGAALLNVAGQESVSVT